MIDWDSDSTEILLNPRYSTEDKEKYTKMLQSIEGYPGHVWLATSGTSGKLKFAALSKKAILTSATAVNIHLHSNASDVWVNPLPDFHVGGVGIMARSYLSGSKVIDFKTWDPIFFCDVLHTTKGTLTALVPTQLFDLITKKMQPPASLRAVIIGGGALDDNLYDRAKALGWPILPSYGLTECSSQVATASKNSKQLMLLPHVSVKIDQGFISIKSDALLSLYAMITNEGVELVDPKKDGWFLTEDKGELQENTLNVFGRSSDFIKIGGESVDLNYLRSILNKLRMELDISEDMELIAVPDSRLGKVIHILSTGNVQFTEHFVQQFNNQVLPFSRIRHIQSIEIIPRTPLGKPLKQDQETKETTKGLF